MTQKELDALHEENLKGLIKIAINITEHPELDEDDFHDEMLLPPGDRYLKLIQGGKIIRARSKP